MKWFAAFVSRVYWLVVGLVCAVPWSILLWSAGKHMRAERYDLALKRLGWLPARVWQAPVAHSLHQWRAKCYRHLGRAEEAKNAEASARELKIRREKFLAERKRPGFLESLVVSFYLSRRRKTNR